MSVRTYVRTVDVRPSTKRFFDFSEIWHVGRGRRVMYDGMQYDPIQGQRSSSRTLQSWKSGRFQKLSPPPFTITAGN